MTGRGRGWRRLLKQQCQTPGCDRWVPNGERRCFRCGSAAMLEAAMQRPVPTGKAKPWESWGLKERKEGSNDVK